MVTGMLIRGMTQARIDGDRVNAIASHIPPVAGVGTALDASRCKGIRTALFNHCAGSPEEFTNDQ